MGVSFVYRTPDVPECTGSENPLTERTDMAKRTDAQTGDISTEELEIDPELEAETPAAETDADAEVEEDEDEVPPQRAQPQHQEEFIPKSRYDEVNRRTQLLEQALEEIRATRQQPVQQTQLVEQADPDEGLTPEAKNWAKFIRRVTQSDVDNRVRAQISKFQQEQVLPLQRDSVVVKDMVDDQTIRRQHKDYHLFEDDVKEIRQEWYKSTGVLAPREIAYALAKLRRGQLAGPAERTSDARSKAKAGATVSSKAPTRKVAPKTSLSLDDVSRMSEADLEKALIENKVTF